MMIAPGHLLRAALWARRRDLVLATVLYSSHQLGEAMVPVIIGAAVSEAVDHGSPAGIALWLGVLGADFLLLSTSYRFGARASVRAKQHTGHTVRMWLTERVVQPAGGVRNSPGDLLSRASSDTSRVGAYAGQAASAVAAAVVLLVSVVLLLRFSVLLGVISLAGAAALLAAQHVVGRFVHARSLTEQHAQARATALAEDTVRGLRVLKGIGAEDGAVTEYAKASRQAIAAARQATSSGAALAAAGALLSGAYLTVVAGTGGYLALTDRIGLGALVSALGLAQFVVGPMQTLAGAAVAHARAAASAARVHEVLTQPPAVEDGTSGTAGTTVRFENVRLPARRKTLISTETAPSGLTGITCDDPAAAAAIPALLAREHDPAEGRILLGGRDIRDAGLTELRRHILVSPHDAVLLPGTVDDNLAALKKDDNLAALKKDDNLAALKQAEHAVRAAGADQVIEGTAYGARTDVGDRGEALSGGQRQRVALARALAADPPILVLHDPTTAVDAVTEDRIAERVRELRGARPTIVVTNSPAWLTRCDHIITVQPAP
ncbi:ABC transporter transmembrane domain-containing protein [Dactylosporangium sp. CS-033363]|uniref:ABC transporter transmembrane domain-containing protein n=1 Tax=Dactylosporangium sp. CS-033363 TaxID=3239935 RepID=UPI003D91E474